jgi:hypothetical protein
VVGVFGVADLALDDLATGQPLEKSATRRDEDPYGECQVIFQKM